MEAEAKTDDAEGEQDLELEGGSPRCPFCDEQDECDHLFARLDLSNACCEGGYCHSRWGELHEAARNAFHPLLVGHEHGVIWKCAEVEELWSWAQENFKEQDPEDDVCIDGYALMRLLTDLLCDQGLAELSDDFEGGGPGQSTAGNAFYSEWPAAAFDETLQAMKRALVPTRPKPRKKRAAASGQG